MLGAAISIAMTVQAGAATPRLITGECHTIWASRPAEADVTAAYPPQVRASRLDGRATAACRLGDDGRLQQCRVVSETPGGAGFGRAALRLTALFRVKAACAPAPGATIRVPVTFQSGEARR